MIRAPGLRGAGLSTVTELDVHAGDRIPLAFTWYASREPLPQMIDPQRALLRTFQSQLDRNEIIAMSDTCSPKGPPNARLPSDSRPSFDRCESFQRAGKEFNARV